MLGSGGDAGRIARMVRRYAPGADDGAVRSAARRLLASAMDAGPVHAARMQDEGIVAAGPVALGLVVWTARDGRSAFGSPGVLVCLSFDGEGFTAEPWRRSDGAWTRETSKARSAMGMVASPTLLVQRSLHGIAAIIEAETGQRMDRQDHPLAHEMCRILDMRVRRSIRVFLDRTGRILGADRWEILSRANKDPFEDWRFFLAGGERGKRRMQALASYPALGFLMPKLREVIDEGRPLMPALADEVAAAASGLDTGLSSLKAAISRTGRTRNPAPVRTLADRLMARCGMEGGATGHVDWRGRSEAPGLCDVIVASSVPPEWMPDEEVFEGWRYVVSALPHSRCRLWDAEDFRSAAKALRSIRGKWSRARAEIASLNPPGHGSSPSVAGERIRECGLVVARRRFLLWHWASQPFLGLARASALWHRRPGPSLRGITGARTGLPRWRTPLRSFKDRSGIATCLGDAEALIREGMELGHCVGTYTPRCLFGRDGWKGRPSHIVSIRTKQGRSTAEIVWADRKAQVVQHHGPLDGLPLQENSVLLSRPCAAAARGWAEKGFVSAEEDARKRMRDGMHASMAAGFYVQDDKMRAASAAYWRPFFPLAGREGWEDRIVSMVFQRND
jgi:hypothetical protein